MSLTSLRFDRHVKARVYARAGIPEYWIANVDTRFVEVFRDPDPDTGLCRTMVTIECDATLASTAVPGLSVAVGPLFD